jgi:hypothetical protein
MMHTLLKVLVFLHVTGFALLLGGAVAQYLSGRVRINTAMLTGAAAQVVTGLALAAPIRGHGHEEPSRVGVGIKLVIALCVLAMTFFSRKREKVNTGHFLAIIVLTLGNAAIGVFWL